MDNSTVSLLLTPLWLFLLFEAYLCASGPKLTVLYLRRFRFTPSQVVVSAALEQALARRYRVVTLDDASFEPMEVPRLYRWISRYAGAAVWTVFVVVLLGVLAYFFALTSPTIGGMIWGMVLLLLSLFAPIVLVVVTAAILAFTLVLLSIRARVRRQARLRVNSEFELAGVLEQVRRAQGWSKRSTLLAPRATTVRVANSLWETAVRQLSGVANVVLMDVSVGTDAVQWELDLLAERGFGQTVFIASRETAATHCLPPGQCCVYYENASKAQPLRLILAALTDELDRCAGKPAPLTLVEVAARPLVSFVRGLFAAVCAIFLGYLVTLGLVALLGLGGPSP